MNKMNIVIPEKSQGKLCSKIQIKGLFDIAIIDDAQNVPEIETTLVLNEIRPTKLLLFGDMNMQSVFD